MTCEYMLFLCQNIVREGVLFIPFMLKLKMAFVAKMFSISFNDAIYLIKNTFTFDLCE